MQFPPLRYGMTNKNNSKGKGKSETKADPPAPRKDDKVNGEG
jgi:hypothetical protein